MTKVRTVGLTVLLTILAVAGTTAAQDRVASLAEVAGDVIVHRAGTGADEPVEMVGPRVRGGSVFAGDVISTRAASTASIAFADGTSVDMKENTSLSVKEVDFSSLMTAGKKDKPTGRIIQVLAGNILSHVVANPQVATEFETPSGVAAVKGTTLEIGVDSEGRATLKIDDGTVVSTASFTTGGNTSVATVILSSGQQIRLFRRADGGLDIINDSTSPVDVTVGGKSVSLGQDGGASFQVGAGGDTTVTNMISAAGTVTVNNGDGTTTQLGNGEQSSMGTNLQRPAPRTPDTAGGASCGECGVSDGGGGCVYIDSSCPQGKKCVNGLCVGTPTSSCNDTNCPPPLFQCQGGSCVTIASCADDTECAPLGSEFRCVNSVCARGGVSGVTCSGCAVAAAGGQSCLANPNGCRPLGTCVVAGSVGTCSINCGGCALPSADGRSCFANATACAAGQTCNVVATVGTCVSNVANCTGCAIPNPAGGCLPSQVQCAPLGVCTVAGTVGTCSIACSGCAVPASGNRACVGKSARCSQFHTCVVAGTVGTCVPDISHQ